MKIPLISIIILCFSSVFVTSIDTLTKSDFLTINQTLISAGGKFELGFFHRGNPKNYYIGIWYKDIPSENVIVWVANRDSPCLSEMSFLKLGNQSNIELYDGESFIRWQTHVSEAVNPVIQLLDSGNLVVREEEDSNLDNVIWQSFDNPTDTLIPGQKLGWNLKTGLDLLLSSWQGPDNPGVGNFTFDLDYHGDPEIYMKNGDKIIYRSGPWVGQRFSGVPEMKSGDQGFNFTFYIGPDEVYYTFELPPDDRVKSRLVVTFDGYLQRWTWVPDMNQWSNFWYARKDQCDYYRVCGPYSVCNVSALFVCECPQGFKPKNSNAWKLRDGSSGCIRETELDCQSDGFLPLYNMKLPETSTAFVDASLSLKQCGNLCKRNCSCTAYANFEFVRGVGSGCVIWTDNLTDMRDYVDGGQTLYMRLSAADLGSSSTNGFNQAKKIALAVGISTATAILLAGLTTFIVRKRKNYGRNPLPRVGRDGASERSQELPFSGHMINNNNRKYSSEANDVDDLELPIYDFHSMVIATDNFCEANKLGQGGFGRVYKGVMLDGQEVAVKRLSKGSGQGAEEFKNELRLIAKLQHRNLVRLLGCCVEMDEKMLIYEYLENRSLDSILFHKERNALLNWQTRFDIISGIARGLLYLHQDSRYRIVHRDLKASNVLLDAHMTPKISDFGMARIFGGDETEGNTRIVVGTYGYMAPEYAMDGVFSIKSDVFSFGVLVLEILTGTKNRGFYNSDHELNLLGFCWKQWREGNGTEMVDRSIGEQYSIDEVLRCLQIGLLCVQERPEDRPTMASVVLMLSSESISLPRPKVPGFCMGLNPNETDTSSDRQDQTVNQVTVTMLSAR
ncbi:receptor-like serine/threonine-protein kinase SD1-8 [Silene latifolia]|uniref:receptor-like serine/threonine-protein kinase SD1-8 n=1 Tax=Silene latifolia TaxID=37657 RepID=UPI003D76CC10